MWSVTSKVIVVSHYLIYQSISWIREYVGPIMTKTLFFTCSSSSTPANSRLSLVPFFLLQMIYNPLSRKMANICTFCEKWTLVVCWTYILNENNSTSYWRFIVNYKASLLTLYDYGLCMSHYFFFFLIDLIGKINKSMKQHDKKELKDMMQVNFFHNTSVTWCKKVTEDLVCFSKHLGRYFTEKWPFWGL